MAKRKKVSKEGELGNQFEYHAVPQEETEAQETQIPSVPVFLAVNKVNQKITVNFGGKTFNFGPFGRKNDLPDGFFECSEFLQLEKNHILAKVKGE